MKPYVKTGGESGTYKPGQDRNLGDAEISNISWPLPPTCLFPSIDVDRGDGGGGSL